MTADSTTAMDAIPHAVVIVTAGRVVRLNAAAERLFATTQDRALGRSLIEVVRDHRLESLAGGTATLELELGARTVLARGVADGLVLEDVTETRAREREHRDALAMLAHEFRTPVAAIKGLLEALRDDLPDATRERFLGLGLTETERLVRLVEDLTIGFRAQAERTFPVADTVQRAERLLERDLLERGVTLHTKGTGTVVRCDPDKLLQVLLNLLENASRYAELPGEVTVRVSDDRPLVRVEVESAGEPLPDGAKPFGARWRGPQSRGSGMGLYIVASIVHGWGGEVWHRHANRRNIFGFSVPPAQGDVAG